ncbi:MAG: iron chaperone [Sphingobacteriaceae bacterium]
MDASKKFPDVNAYIAAQEPAVQPRLQEIRQLVKKTIPEAREVISYNMPAFKYLGMLLYYAAFKKHYSVFISPGILADFKTETAPYQSGKATLQMSFSESFPPALLIKLLLHTAGRNRQKAADKAQKKKEKLKADKKR